MTKYLINRILRSLCSVVIVVGVVMVMIYSALDRNLIFAVDAQYTKVQGNAKEVYCMQQWEKYGYMDYVPYTDYLKELLKEEEITQETYAAVAKFGDTAEKDSDAVAEYVQKFTEEYESKGYEVIRLPAKMKVNTKKYAVGGEPRLYAYNNIPVLQRMVKYFAGLFTVDNIHHVQEEIEDRGITFTLYDPAYGGESFRRPLWATAPRISICFIWMTTSLISIRT